MCAQKRQAKYNYRPLYIASLAQSCATKQVWRVVTTSFFFICTLIDDEENLRLKFELDTDDPVRLSFCIATVVDRNCSHCFRVSPKYLIIESWLLSSAHSKWLLYW